MYTYVYFFNRHYCIKYHYPYKLSLKNANQLFLVSLHFFKLLDKTYVIKESIKCFLDKHIINAMWTTTCLTPPSLLLHPTNTSQHAFHPSNLSESQVLMPPPNTMTPRQMSHDAQEESLPLVIAQMASDLMPLRYQ